MKITLADTDNELSPDGVAFKVYDKTGQMLGILDVRPSDISWRRGKTLAGKGVAISWTDIMEFFYWRKKNI
jgi:hypothetical protein